MSTLPRFALTATLLASFVAPSHAFMTELVVGLTSVTNNLIDSSESVTNNTVNVASSTMLSLSSNPGKMADRIGLMADRIGFMADRIVTTEGIMAGLAHKIIDASSQPRVVQQYASAYAPQPPAAQNFTAGYGNTYGNMHGNSYANTNAFGQRQALPIRTAGDNHYMVAKPAPAVAQYGYATQPDNSRYSASNMIYGVTGATYTAAWQPPVTQTKPQAQPSDYGFAAQPAVRTVQAGNSCGTSYEVPRSC